MTLAYIGLGANLGEPLQQLQQALQQLDQLPNSRLLACSPWYRSVAIGPAGQPDYINGVCAIETSLPPLDLLDQTQAIENALGRIRKERWGARCIDLDILLYGDDLIDQDRLIIPHPEMLNRNFVLCPLADIYHQATLPGKHDLSQRLNDVGMVGLARHTAEGVSS